MPHSCPERVVFKMLVGEMRQHAATYAETERARSEGNAMLEKLIQFVAIVSSALYLVPTGAHLFELPHKITMSQADYMTVQRIYAGWQNFGIIVAVAIIATLAQAILARRNMKAFILALVAFVALGTALVTFALFTYPVNVASKFWTTVPEPFEVMRRQWEYSHAASALLTFVALMANVLSALQKTPETKR